MQPPEGWSKQHPVPCNCDLASRSGEKGKKTKKHRNHSQISFFKICFVVLDVPEIITENTPNKTVEKDNLFHLSGTWKFETGFYTYGSERPH